ncbi:MAG: SAM-dependent methyltransferase, partial [Fibrobacteria bacterium]|nr:SAM-dependent methyltransferase [Fibrobacteria bacterium]
MAGLPERHGRPIAYWVSAQIRKIFADSEVLGNLIDARQGMATSDNNRFLRLWWEISLAKKAGLVNSHEEAKATGKKWFPLNKGGIYRKWYGNQEYLVNWENDGEEVMGYAAELYGSPTRTIKSISEYFKASVSWSDVTSAESAFRWYPTGFIFDATGHSAFPNSSISAEQLLSFCNSKLASKLFKILNPTMHFHVGYFKLLPTAVISHSKIVSIVSNLIQWGKDDWDSNEISWNFTNTPLLKQDYKNQKLK